MKRQMKRISVLVIALVSLVFQGCALYSVASGIGGGGPFDSHPRRAVDPIVHAREECRLVKSVVDSKVRAYDEVVFFEGEATVVSKIGMVRSGERYLVGVDTYQSGTVSISFLWSLNNHLVPCRR